MNMKSFQIFENSRISQNETQNRTQTLNVTATTPRLEILNASSLKCKDCTTGAVWVKRIEDTVASRTLKDHPRRKWTI